MPARKKSRWVTSDGGDQVAEQADHRDRVRRQPRLDQALAGVGTKLLPVAGWPRDRCGDRRGPCGGAEDSIAVRLDGRGAVGGPRPGSRRYASASAGAPTLARTRPPVGPRRQRRWAITSGGQRDHPAEHDVDPVVVGGDDHDPGDQDRPERPRTPSRTSGGRP